MEAKTEPSPQQIPPSWQLLSLSILPLLTAWSVSLTDIIVLYVLVLAEKKFADEHTNRCDFWNYNPGRYSTRSGASWMRSLWKEFSERPEVWQKMPWIRPSTRLKSRRKASRRKASPSGLTGLPVYIRGTDVMAVSYRRRKLLMRCAANATQMWSNYRFQITDYRFQI